ncbi:meiosis inhibitor protein 1-like [Lytechinus variegatus]|uniref:meiosis inhibitor protein 1-like n=1 Tax=Lytechinus variegatus TaxID=7654 RepID=UPI001BB2AA4E|nr:meiosis inhibitor protein 1-like [Lytechinus variegatus]
MSVLLNGLRLVMVCHDDPTSDPGVFLKPQTSNPVTERSSPEDEALCENNLSSFSLYLMESLDSVCIPAIMANHKGLSRPGIYASLFESLSIMLSLHNDDGLNRLAEKLVGSSFIQLAMEVRHQFQSQEGITELIKSSDSFLVDLLHSCSSQGQSSPDVNISTDMVHNITGAPGEICHLLGHHEDTTSRSSSHRDTQQCLMALLYYARLYGDRCVSSSDLLKCLTSFITQHPDITSLSLSSSKHLLFLFADCFVHSGTRAGSSACYILADHMTRLEVKSLYTNHRSLIQWVFMASNIPTQAAEKMLTQWIDHLDMHIDEMRLEDLGEDDDIAFTLHLMAQHSTCLDIMLDVLKHELHPTGRKCASLIKQLLSANQTIEDTQDMERIKKRIPDLLQACSMKDSTIQTGAELGCILEVLCALYQNYPSITLEEIDLKIIYHVINVLTKNAENSDDVIYSSLNFLLDLLVHTARHGESRVVSLIVSNGAILTCLECHCNMEPALSVHLDIHCCALNLLAHLTIYQKHYNMKVSQKINLKEDVLLRLVTCSSKVIQQLASIQLWTALFLSSASQKEPSSSCEQREPSLIKVCSDKRRKLLEEEDLGLPVSCQTLRNVFASLQNVMLQGNDLLLHASVICIKSMINMTADKNPTANQHLLSQPWNQLLINCVVELYQDSNSINQAIPELITLFLRQGNVQSYVKQHHVDSLLISILKTEPTQHDRQQATAIQHLLNAVRARPEIVLSKRQDDQITAWMDKLKTHLLQLPQHHPVFYLLYP